MSQVAGVLRGAFAESTLSDSQAPESVDLRRLMELLPADGIEEWHVLFSSYLHFLIFTLCSLNISHLN